MQTTDSPRDRLDECEQAARTQGIASGLALALVGVDVATPPGPIAAVPSSQVAAQATVTGHAMAAREGISFVRCTGRPTGVGTSPREFAALLAAARLGITQRLLDWATDHLSHRISADEPIIRKQLVLGTVADLHTAIEATRRSVHLSWDIPAAMIDVHHRITALDWEAAKLLGASGYVSGSPTWAAYVSWLVANCWIPGGGDTCLN